VPAQTAVEFEAGRVEPGGKPQPFKWSMLYDVVRQLVPTPELIFMAWSQSLDYNIGTSSHTFAAMTSVCEVFGMKIADWMKKPPTCDVQDLIQHESNHGNGMPQFAPPAGILGREPRKGDPAWVNSSDEEIEKAWQTWTLGKQTNENNNKFAKLPDIMDERGMTMETAKDIVVAMERQRKATSAYRHRCTMDGNSQLVMDDPVDTIERIMASVPVPLDAEASSSDSSGDYMPLYSSCIMANCVHVCTLHTTQAVAQWMAGHPTTDQFVGNCKTVGTHTNVAFAKSKRKGAYLWNTAWMRQDQEVTGWMDFSRKVIGDSRVRTVKIFDLPINGFRDLAFLLSTRDNSRRCTEDPHMIHSKSPNTAFATPDGAELDESSNRISMRGVKDVRGRGAHIGIGMPKHLPRHAYSKVNDVELQRCIDSAMIAGRFPAISTTYSNKVTDGPPLRLVSGEGDKKIVELNTAAALEHTKMMAEGVLRCSVHPGCQNAQERFTNDEGGPPEFSSPYPDKSDTMIHKMSYSYDIMSIALTLDAMGRYYDPDGKDMCELYKQEYGESLGIKVDFEDLPHMSMRFVGLEEETDRRLISCKVPENSNPVYPYLEAGDKFDKSNIEECRPMVSVSLGHYATDDEVSRYLKSRAGSRSMSGVFGDLMSMRTWQKHSLVVLKERGMISGEDDIVAQLTNDEPYQLRTRLTEAASRAINILVDKNGRMKEAERPVPGDETLSREKLENAKEERRLAMRNELYNTMFLPEHLDELRHCGSLRIKNECFKRTYQHSAKNADMSFEKDQENAAPQPTPYNAASATESEASWKRMQQKSLPHKKEKPVASRGMHDSRRRP
jgi:hypothetical protein